jgi:NAD(P)-dependent dehydrogenase (short-subunit alcohol dehydrogenase family)
VIGYTLGSDGRAGVPQRTAIVTGASSGIGFALARLLGQEGHALTIAARRPEKLEGARAELEAEGLDVVAVAADLGSEEDIARVVAAHRERHDRLDVLVNNAGVGMGQPVAEIATRKLDIQLATNLRSIPLLYRDCADLLAVAGAEHGNALVVNSASIAGKHGEAWLSVYSATKAGVIAFTQAMNAELNGRGIKSTALCPAFVDTPMTDFLKDRLPGGRMIQTSDIAESVRFLLRLSPGCVVPEIVFNGPGGRPEEHLS